MARMIKVSGELFDWGAGLGQAATMGLLVFLLFNNKNDDVMHMPMAILIGVMFVISMLISGRKDDDELAKKVFIFCCGFTVIMSLLALIAHFFAASIVPEDKLIFASKEAIVLYVIIIVTQFSVHFTTRMELVPIFAGVIAVLAIASLIAHANPRDILDYVIGFAMAFGYLFLAKFVFMGGVLFIGSMLTGGGASEEEKAARSKHRKQEMNDAYARERERANKERQRMHYDSLKRNVSKESAEQYKRDNNISW